MGLFMISIFSFMLLMPFAQDRSTANCGDLDLIQLTHKIQNGELRQLTVRRDEIVANDRAGNCEYHTWVTSKHTRAEILQQAREPDANGQPRVPSIDEEETRSTGTARISDRHRGPVRCSYVYDTFDYGVDAFVYRPGRQE